MLFHSLLERTDGAMRDFTSHMQQITSSRSPRSRSPCSPLLCKNSRSCSTTSPQSLHPYNNKTYHQPLSNNSTGSLSHSSLPSLYSNATSVVYGNGNGSGVCIAPGASPFVRWLNCLSSLLKVRIILLCVLSILGIYVLFFLYIIFVYAVGMPLSYSPVHRISGAILGKLDPLVAHSENVVCVSNFVGEIRSNGRNSREIFGRDEAKKDRHGAYPNKDFYINDRIRRLRGGATVKWYSDFPSFSPNDISLQNVPLWSLSYKEPLWPLTLCSSNNTHQGTFVTQLIIPDHSLWETNRRGHGNIQIIMSDATDSSASPSFSPSKKGKQSELQGDAVDRKGASRIGKSESSTSLQFQSLSDLYEFLWQGGAQDGRKNRLRRLESMNEENKWKIKNAARMGDEAESATLNEEVEYENMENPSEVKSRVVHMVWAGANAFSAKVIWTLDSLFYRMKNVKVRLHILLPKSMRIRARQVHFVQLYPFWENGYDLQYVEHTDITPYLKHTPLENAGLSSERMAGKGVATELLKDVISSDVLRIVALYKEGGIYVDTDMVVLQDLSPLRNMFACENRDFSHSAESCVICNAVMAFDKGHPFLRYALENANTMLQTTPLEKLAHERWGIMGPRLLMDVLTTKWSQKDGAETYYMEKSKKGHQYLTDNSSLVVYSYRSFYPIYWDGHNEDGIAQDKYWKSEKFNETLLNNLTDPAGFTLHLFGKAMSDASRNFLESLMVDNGSVMAKLYQRNCNLFCNTNVLKLWARETEPPYVLSSRLTDIISWMWNS